MLFQLIKTTIILFVSMLMLSCNEKKRENELPILGERAVKTITVNGQTLEDSVYHTIPAFKFVDQDSIWISNASVANKIYLADFFFTRCPTICPLLAKNMSIIAKEFADEERFMILSHTIDEHYDTPNILHAYAKKLEAPSNWRFLNGPQASVYHIAGKDGYFSYAETNADAPGGFDHSGAFTLVDKQGRVRGVYDGTQESDATKAIEDIKTLLANF